MIFSLVPSCSPLRGFVALVVLLSSMQSTKAFGQTDSSVDEPTLAIQSIEPSDSSGLIVPPAIEENVDLEVIEPVQDNTTLLPACPQNYWVVSTRRCVQTIHLRNRGPWTQDVYYGVGNGQLSRSCCASLSSQLVPGIPVCIVSHGSFVTWNSQCQQSLQAARQFRAAACGQAVQLIFFTWPSDGPYTLIAPLDVSVRGHRAEFNGFHLAALISQIPESCPVTIVGHSHGSRVALSAMHLAAGGTVQKHRFNGNIGANRRFRVIMAAAAVDHHWLNPGQRYGLALNRIECLLNLRNQNDLALAWYPLTRPFSRRSVARSGLTSRDLYLIGWNSQKVRQVDVTNRIGSAHQWPEYYSDPHVLGAILPYMVSF